MFGGILATTFNNPFDVVVSRARNIIDYSAAPYKCGIMRPSRLWSHICCRYSMGLPSVIRIMRTEGIGALFLGFPAKVLQSPFFLSCVIDSTRCCVLGLAVES